MERVSTSGPSQGVNRGVRHVGSGGKKTTKSQRVKEILEMSRRTGNVIAQPIPKRRGAEKGVGTPG